MKQLIKLINELEVVFGDYELETLNSRLAHVIFTESDITFVIEKVYSDMRIRVFQSRNQFECLSIYGDYNESNFNTLVNKIKSFLD